MQLIAGAFAKVCLWILTCRALESFIAFVLPGSPAQHMYLLAKAASLQICRCHAGLSLWLCVKTKGSKPKVADFCNL